MIESTEADSSACKTAFCQTQLDADDAIVGYSYAITITDADGNVTGYIHETTTTDANGTYFSSNQYDASGNLTESTYSDGTSTWVSTYQTDTGADGNVTGYTDGSEIGTAEIDDIICYVCSGPCGTESPTEEMVVPNDHVMLVGISEYNQIDLFLV